MKDPYFRKQVDAVCGVLVAEGMNYEQLREICDIAAMAAGNDTAVHFDNFTTRFRPIQQEEIPNGSEEDKGS